jgi:hypothetical protein
MNSTLLVILDRLLWLNYKKLLRKPLVEMTQKVSLCFDSPLQSCLILTFSYVEIFKQVADTACRLATVVSTVDFTGFCIKSLALLKQIFQRLYEYATSHVHISVHLTILEAIRDVCKRVVKELTSWVRFFLSFSYLWLRL